jgi:Mn-dependent DtxR family transcriptional regulator
VSTIARRLGVSFDQAEAMAVAADKAGLVRHQVHTVTLTGEGPGARRRARDSDGEKKRRR